MGEGSSDERYGYQKTDVSNNSQSDEETANVTVSFWSLDPPPGLEDPSLCVNMAWEVLPSDSLLFKSLVQFLINSRFDGGQRTPNPPYHAGFLAAVAELDRSQDYNHTYVVDWVYKGEICKFHEHNPESRCSFAKLDVVKNGRREESCSIW